jgi:hypothetical protein
MTDKGSVSAVPEVRLLPRTRSANNRPAAMTQCLWRLYIWYIGFWSLVYVILYNVIAASAVEHLTDPKCRGEQKKIMRARENEERSFKHHVPNLNEQDELSSLGTR